MMLISILLSNTNAHITNIKKEIAFSACYHFGKISPPSDSWILKNAFYKEQNDVYIGSLTNRNK